MFNPDYETSLHEIVNFINSFYGLIANHFSQGDLISRIELAAFLERHSSYSLEAQSDYIELMYKNTEYRSLDELRSFGHAVLYQSVRLQANNLS